MNNINNIKTQNQIADISINNAAIIAGISLLLMAIIAPIANFSIFQELIDPSDVAKTVSNIRENIGIFRIGIVLFFIVALLDILVAWALYIFLRQQNKSLSLLTAWLRVVYASILCVVIINLINVLQLLNGADYLSVFSESQLQTQIMLSLNIFNKGWEFGLIIFGFHLLLLGYLILKAGYMRKILGILILLAALGYIIDGFGKLLLSNYSISISMFTFIGEVILIFWLLIVGRKIKE
ncbi:MAG: DUF4386 domain-containing protein [Bacteroidetes bacterium]|nr:DUF4386 domain-containing protein [Bacteroidota bacterium]MBU1115105.1 DUF4386 domain-containing protein [Bacteroidota bacterium]MBU1800082.1 DUF4386 domain-containing protein [Bacteroidota bacterium]